MSTTTTASPSTTRTPLWKKLVKLQNPYMVWMLRSPLHVWVSNIYMLITFTGRKSGKVYTTPVQYARVEDTVYVVTSQQYVWWKNLIGGAEVEVRLRGKDYHGFAEAITDPAAIDAALRYVYPKMPTETRQNFVAGKVALMVKLR